MHIKHFFNVHYLKSSMLQCFIGKNGQINLMNFYFMFYSCNKGFSALMGIIFFFGSVWIFFLGDQTQMFCRENGEWKYFCGSQEKNVIKVPPVTFQGREDMGSTIKSFVEWILLRRIMAHDSWVQGTGIIIFREFF